MRKIDVDLERTTSIDIIQIGSMDIPAKDCGKKMIVLDNKVVTPIQATPAAIDYEASSSGSSSKYFFPRWCPPGLTRTQW